MSEIRQTAIKGVVSGDRFRIERTFTESDIQRFAELSRDFNPVHHDTRFTAAKGFDGVICHGLLVGALLTEIGGQLGLLASAMEFRFVRPVYPGQRIECLFAVRSVDDRGRLEAEVTMRNPAGEPVIVACVRGHLPQQEARAALAALLSETANA
ncbi:MaoC/PaaZ C-terminal domain-containing protein [Motiliproteus sp. SC1-56]|uniref:MaoC/PaaZ C-terminal domain-containing protein n=1 Tax=Motiliproteus sp. SC1-56 TaxID=2799565 RepID=UPI001A8CE1A9